MITEMDMLNKNTHHLNCQVIVTKGRDGESICGYPQYTNASSLCETHHKDFMENAHIRLQTYPRNPDWISQFQKNGNNHSVNQMLFSFEMMYKMLKILSPKPLSYWFEYMYKDNPHYAEVVDMLNQTEWKLAKSVSNPITEAFTELNIDPNIGF